MTDLWPKISKLAYVAQRPARYINGEWGATYKLDASYQFCMVYPDTYELGQANQAVRILCNAVNACDDMGAQRAFLPALEFCDVLRENNLPMFSLEGCSPLNEFDSIGITLPHELAATNIVEAIHLAGLHPLASERGEDDPLILGGGPCAFNPEPYACFYDVILIGEGEELVCEVLSVHKQMKAKACSKREILNAIAGIEGAYVPSLYTQVATKQEAQRLGAWVVPNSEGVPAVINKRIFEGFSDSNAWEPCVVPYTEVVHDRLNVEILRGCTRGCRFCQAGMLYRPVRERSVENIVNAVVEGLAQTGYDEVSLTSLSSTDHSQISEILTSLNEKCANKGVKISIPSQRLDSFGVEMAKLVAGQKRGGLTFAPEAGTQRLRDVINKNITEDDLFSAVEGAFNNGWRRCKLYFMIGLPTETDDDIKGIASLLQRVYDKARLIVPPEQRGNIAISASIAVFVPKSQTPFQWDGQLSPDEALRRVNLLRNSVKYKAINIGWHDPKTSLIEAVLSRGGRICGSWIYEAWKLGARFDAWSEHFNEQAWIDAATVVGVQPENMGSAQFEIGEVMPWDHISAGVSVDYLVSEREEAQNCGITPDCSYDSCTDCGVCPALGSSIVTCEVRND